MSKVEIEIESGKGCCEDCPCMNGMGKPAESKDALMAELKALLNDNRANGQADRQMKIDELMSKISDMGEED